MNKIQMAFIESAKNSEAAKEILEDAKSRNDGSLEPLWPMSRRQTVHHIESHKPIRHDLFGQWTNQLNHQNFGLIRELIYKTRTRGVKPKPVRAKLPKYTKESLCLIANKRKYSFAGAQRALNGALSRGSGTVPRRMYFCEHCRSHHLTSSLL